MAFLSGSLPLRKATRGFNEKEESQYWKEREALVERKRSLSGKKEKLQLKEREASVERKRSLSGKKEKP